LKDNLLPAVNVLNSFLDQTSVIWNENSETPAPNSQADLELASFSRRESVATAYSQSGMLFEAAADYSMALVKTLTPPAMTIAPWGITRSAMEMSALATWLWDTKIHAYQRVQRSLAFWHKGLIDELKLAKKSGGFLDPKKVVARINYVEHIALELGIGNIVNKRGRKEFVFKKEMPTNTEVITDMLNKEQEYRLLSAMTHGRNWALQSLGFETVKIDQTIFEGVKGGHLEKKLNFSSINYLCTSALTSLASPILMKFKLYGWNARTMTILIKRNQDELAKLQEGH